MKYQPVIKMEVEYVSYTTTNRTRLLFNHYNIRCMDSGRVDGPFLYRPHTSKKDKLVVYSDVPIKGLDENVYENVHDHIFDLL